MDSGSIGIDPDLQLRNVRLFEVHIRRTWQALTFARRLGYLVLIVLCLHAVYCARNAGRALFAFQAEKDASLTSSSAGSGTEKANVGLAPLTVGINGYVQCTARNAFERLGFVCNGESTLQRRCQTKTSCNGTKVGENMLTKHVQGGVERGWAGRAVKVLLRQLRLCHQVAFWILRGILPIWMFFGMGLYRALLLDSQLYLIRLNRVLSRFHIVFSRTARRLHKAERHSSPAPALGTWSRSETSYVTRAEVKMLSPYVYYERVGGMLRAAQQRQEPRNLWSATGDTD